LRYPHEEVIWDKRKHLKLEYLECMSGHLGDENEMRTRTGNTIKLGGRASRRSGQHTSGASDVY
jgi:hypothetical protein